MKIFFLPLLILVLFSACKNNTNKKEIPKQFTDYGPAENLWERWAYPNATFDQTYYNEVMESAKMQMFQKSGADVSWRVEGPLNIGGRINVIAINPDNSDQILIGTAAGGVFKSNDSGLNWEPIGEDFVRMPIGAIAYNPQNPNEIYVGTGDPNIGGSPETGNGIYKSIDGGLTWNHKGPSEVGIVSKILVHPTQPNIIYMASMGTPYFEDNNRGVYKSVDGGDTWEQMLFLSSQAGVSSLVLNPDNPDTLYAAGWDRIRNNQVSLISGIHSRIYRTYDGGENWNELSAGLPGGVLSRSAVDISRSNPAVLYASFVDPANFEFEGVYRTDNYGDSWQSLNITDLDTELGGFGWYFGQIRINPTNEDNVSVFGVELHTSTNGGDSWFQSTPDWFLFEVHADMHDLVYTPDGDTWLATDGGLYQGTENFDSWDFSSFIPISQFYRIAINPFETGIYAGGMQDNGTSEGNYENSFSWPRLFGGDGFQPIYNPDDQTIFYSTTQNGGLWVFSSNNWNSFVDGIEPNDRVAWDAPFIMSSHNSDVLYTATTKIYKAEDGPISFWVPISPDLNGPPDFLPANRHVITTIAESPINADVLYAGTSDGKVWVTQNNGMNWNDISSGLPDRYVTDMRASATVPGRVYVVHSGYRDGDDIPHIHVSDDFGASWSSLAGDLPDLGINNMEVSANNSDSVLFVATDGGVYFSKDFGTHWNRAGNNMPLILVYDIAIDTLNNRLVAGTFSRSIQSIPIDSLLDFTSGIEKQKPEILFTLYPNPANEILNVSSPTTNKNIPWKIIGVNGQLMTSGKGINQAIDIARLPAGTYVFIPENGKSSRFLKMK